MTTSILLCAALLAADAPAPNKAPISEQALKRAKALKANAKTFALELNYNGAENKPFYRMIVSVPPVNRRRNSPFYRIAQIKESEAAKVIDHLARDGFVHQSIDLGTKRIAPPTMPGYTMKVVAGDLSLYEDLGWGLPMIHRLDRLRNALPDNGKKDMDLLLGRLSGWRKKWRAESPPFVVEIGRDDSRISFSEEHDKTIIDIASEFGIDKATIKRNADEWPDSMVVRLHLSGLESFKAGSGNVAVEWSVASTGDNATRTSLVSGLRVAAVTKDSPYFAEVRIVGGNGKIPLKLGYFEVSLPVGLFDQNPGAITVEWVDFHRK